MNQTNVTKYSVLTAINNYQRIHSDIQFETDQLIDVHSSLSTEHKNGDPYDILIEATSKNSSGEEEKRTFSIQEKDGQLIDFHKL